MHATPEREGQFAVSLSSRDSTHVASLAGELDIATADQLTEALEGLAPSAGECVVIDLSAVSFMDSTGLRVLIAAHRSAAENGYDLIVVTGDSPAKRVLELTRMDEHIKVVPALD